MPTRVLCYGLHVPAWPARPLYAPATREAAQLKSTTMASSLSGQKRDQPEPEVDPAWCCAVCFEVLLDPVALPCGHALDQRCLQKAVASGHQACPTCRRAVPAELPDIMLLLRDTVQQRYPNQVRENPCAERTAQPGLCVDG